MGIKIQGYLFFMLCESKLKQLVAGFIVAEVV